MKDWPLAVLGLGLLGLAACATVFAESHAPIDVSSVPEGATVLVNGEPRGVTPTRLELSVTRTHLVTLRKPGYADAACSIDQKVRAGYVVLDALIWPFLIVDAVTDAWYTLSPKVCAPQLLAAAPTPGQDAAVATDFAGRRESIKAVGTKCAIMPLQAFGIDKSVAQVLDEVLLSELQKAGFEAIGPDDINSLLGFERAKEAAGCDDVSCVAEIGGALGVDYFNSGKIADIDGSPMLTLKLMDVRSGRALARVSKMGAKSIKELPRLVAEAVQELVTQSKL